MDLEVLFVIFALLSVASLGAAFIGAIMYLVSGKSKTIK